jgi:hypothetical protein
MMYIDADERENQRRRDTVVRAICEDYCKKHLLWNLCDYPDAGQCPLSEWAMHLLAPDYDRRYADMQFVDRGV